MKTYIVDTYAWISYFQKADSPFKQPIDENYLATPAIVLSELTRFFAREKIPEPKRNASLEFISSNGLVLPLTAANAIKAGELCGNENLHLVDAIIYSHASEEKKVLTGDKHFIGKKFAEYVPGQTQP